MTMGGSRDDLKVRDGVVGGVFVLVMNDLRFKQRASEVLFHDETVLSDILATGEDQTVSVGAGFLAAFPAAGFLADTVSLRARL